MPPYVDRIVDGELDHLLTALPAVAIEGAKGVGKTATALRRAGTVRKLDDPTQQAIAQGAPERLLHGDPPVLLDEWQRVPSTWDLVRRAVDEGAGAGQFLLTGSATPHAPTHSGAGRIVTVRMRPLALAERGVGTQTVSLRTLLEGERTVIEGATAATLETYTHEIVASGLPGLRHLAGRHLRVQLDGYLQRIVDHDFAELGITVRRPATLRRWMAAYAAATGTTASHEAIRDAATGGSGDKPARSATQPYLDALQRMWIIDPVDPWLPTHNHLRRLSTPTKHHLVDPALVVRLLGLDADALLDGQESGPGIPRDGTLLGSLFESLVTQSVHVYAQAADAQLRHLRTYGGEHEVDLLVVRGDGRVVALEVKLARTVKDADVRNLHWLQERIGPQLLDAVVVTTGPEAYRRGDGIAVVPAALLGA